MTDSRPIPTSLPALMSAEEKQFSLKKQILQIQSSKSLTPKEKAVSMQKLMMKQWTETNELNSPRENSPQRHDDFECQRLEKTFSDDQQTILGCSHYQRSCKLATDCCKKWYTCRFCHDDNEDHAIDRYATKKISCMVCHTIQPISNECSNVDCGIKFGHYYCDVCKFFDNDASKDIYHCDKCKICRIGKGLGIDYFHCERCNACMSLSLQEHKCVERSLESNCPICSCYMFTSTTPVMFLPCGHCMHVSCYEEYTLTNYICPLCSKSLGDMEAYFSRIDELLENEIMPEEYEDYLSMIFCSDCEQKSTTKFHFIYHKCQHDSCGSYNTKVIKQFKLNTEEAELVVISDNLASQMMDVSE